MKRGVSQLVTVVLLVVFIISLGLIVTSWSGGLVKKGITRSETKMGTELECSDVKIVLEKVELENKIIIKNNNLKEDLAGYVVRIITEDNVVVDSKENKIDAYSAKTYDYGNYAGSKGISVVDIKKIEVIPKINIAEEGEEIVDCTNNRVVYCLVLEYCENE